MSNGVWIREKCNSLPGINKNNSLTCHSHLNKPDENVQNELHLISNFDFYLEEPNRSSFDDLVNIDMHE